MVLSYAWTAKTQSLLNLTNTHGMTILQKEPINVPVFSTKRIFKLSLTLWIQRNNTLPQQKLTRGSLYFQFLEQRARTNGNVDDCTFRLNGLSKLLQNTYLLVTKKWGVCAESREQTLRLVGFLGKKRRPFFFFTKPFPTPLHFLTLRARVIRSSDQLLSEAL